MKIKPVNPRLARYVDYIRRTDLAPLPIAAFDDDFEPIGPQIREELQHAGLIYYGGPRTFGPLPEGIYLRPDLAIREPEGL